MISRASTVFSTDNRLIDRLVAPLVSDAHRFPYAPLTNLVFNGPRLQERLGMDEMTATASATRRLRIMRQRLDVDERRAAHAHAVYGFADLSLAR